MLKIFLILLNNFKNGLRIGIETPAAEEIFEQRYETLAFIEVGLENLFNAVRVGGHDAMDFARAAEDGEDISEPVKKAVAVLQETR